MIASGRRKFVADASVILKWFSKFGEEDLQRALILREGFRKRRIDLFAPELLIYEISNVLRYKEMLSESLIFEAMSSIYEMDILFPVNLHIMADAVVLARKYGITVYDSTYLSFAQHVGCHLITADKKLLLKIKDIPGILSISEYELA